MLQRTNTFTTAVSVQRTNTASTIYTMFTHVTASATQTHSRTAARVQRTNTASITYTKFMHVQTTNTASATQTTIFADRRFSRKDVSWRNSRCTRFIGIELLRVRIPVGTVTFSQSPLSLVGPLCLVRCMRKSKTTNQPTPHQKTILVS